MKKILLVMLAAILMTACGAKGSNPSSANSSGATAPPPPAAKPAVGDPVVAKSGSSWFAEGKVRVIEGQKANIAWTQKDRTPTDVDLTNVYLIPKAGTPSTVKADDYVLAKTSTSSDYTDWTITQVTSVSKDVITVKDRSNYTYNLGPDKVIGVSPTDAADIKAEFDKTNKQLDFDKKAQAGRPVAPDGYKPKVGETVVASSASNTWFTGQVKSMTGDKATIVWDSKENSTFDTTLDKIMPNPTAAGATMPAANDYVLIKSPSCTTCSLIYTQVTAVNGSSVEVKDRYDSTYTVRPGEFLILK